MQQQAVMAAMEAEGKNKETVVESPAVSQVQMNTIIYFSYHNTKYKSFC